nr:MAG TPA: hypothetical protein [Caudoviricetes sp.]
MVIYYKSYHHCTLLLRINHVHYYILHCYSEIILK